MKDIIDTRLRFSYHGKRYNTKVKSKIYNDTLIISQLALGSSRLWLISQNGAWRIISDMPICLELKERLVCKVSVLLGTPLGTEAQTAAQLPLRIGVLLNAVLNVLAAKNALHPDKYFT